MILCRTIRSRNEGEEKHIEEEVASEALEMAGAVCFATFVLWVIILNGRT